jgi:hypothetical protein
MTAADRSQTKPRRHYCWYCGKDMGVFDRRFCETTDTCGDRECERAARDAAAQERDEAHEQLDRDMGW